MLGRPFARVLDDIIGCRVDCPLTDTLADEEEVVPLRQGHNVINDRSRWRIDRSLSIHFEEARVNPLAHNDEGEGGVKLAFREDLPDHRNFIVLHVFNLAVADTVSVDDHPLGPGLVHFTVPEITKQWDWPYLKHTHPKRIFLKRDFLGDNHNFVWSEQRVLRDQPKVF
jgi:hypothetical protein